MPSGLSPTPETGQGGHGGKAGESLTSVPSGPPTAQLRPKGQSAAAPSYLAPSPRSPGKMRHSMNLRSLSTLRSLGEGGM